MLQYTAPSRAHTASVARAGTGSAFRSHGRPKRYRVRENTLFVTKLPHDADERTIAEVFQVIGMVIGVFLERNERGDSLNYAFVEFDSPQCVDNAIYKMNRQVVKGPDRTVGARVITVDRVRGRGQMNADGSAAGYERPSGYGHGSSSSGDSGYGRSSGYGSTYGQGSSSSGDSGYGRSSGYGPVAPPSAHHNPSWTHHVPPSSSMVQGPLATESVSNGRVAPLMDEEGEVGQSPLPLDGDSALDMLAAMLSAPNTLDDSASAPSMSAMRSTSPPPQPTQYTVQMLPWAGSITGGSDPSAWSRHLESADAAWS